MHSEQELLSKITVFSKYARFWPELGRRETYEEIVARNRQMHLDRFPHLESKIDHAYKYVLDKRVFPSMRSFQFAGEPILRSPSRIYNCGARFADEVSFFPELMFLLLGGTGVGYSVQKHHVANLPTIKEPVGQYRAVIGDSIEGWSHAVEELFNAYLLGMPKPNFDYSEIRPYGAILKTSGGRAPGPEPLRKSLTQLEEYLSSKGPGAQLTPIEVHDMATWIARAVLSGGIRRSAMISLFSPDDEEMLLAKSGTWWEHSPDRAYANNSALLVRGEDDHLFHGIFDMIKASGSGEPGISWANSREEITNPCHEVKLNNKQFCNLVSINADSVTGQEDLEERARVAAFLGTLQASYTDFHFLTDGWRKQTEEEALIGVSMAGIASGRIYNLDIARAARVIVQENEKTAASIGINPAARTTLEKPDGTTSLVAGTSSGVHAWHDNYFIRRSRYHKSEPIAQYLMEVLPYNPESNPDMPEVVEDDVMNPEQIVLSVPQKAPEGAVTRHEGALSLLQRVKWLHEDWIRPGNRYGGSTNNVSATINVADHEWDEVRDWMWNNRYSYNGLSILPFSDHTYKQAPFESISREKYEILSKRVQDIDLTKIDESEDYTDLSGELACMGGACTLP